MSRVTDALLKPFDPNREPPQLDLNCPDFVYRPGYSPFVFWTKNGDFPGDENITETTRFERSEEGAIVGFFRKSEISPTSFCPLCGNVYHNHGELKKGFVDERDVKYKGMVCPGTWLLRTENGIKIMTKEELIEKYRFTEDECKGIYK